MVSVHSMVLGLTAASVATAVSASSAASLSALPTLDLPTFDYPSLAQGDTPQRLLEALTTDGVVALKNIPNYANLRDGFFRRAAECALRGYESPSEQTPHVSRKLFADGTQRYTISTNAGRELSASGAEAEAFADCPGYAARHLALSQAMEHAVNSFGAALDATAFTASDGHTRISSRRLVSEAVRLDHFHAYEASTESTGETSPVDDQHHRQLELSLPLHEDHGLFIAMAAPKYFEVVEGGDRRQLVERELAADASGLIIQTASGERVRPVLHGDEVVLMMGSGASRWLKTSHALPAVLHGMKMPAPLVSASGEGRRSLRAWFGKMTLLPAYQRMLSSSASFEAHVNATTRQLVTSEEAQLMSVGCATGRHLAASDEKCTLKQCSTKTGAADPAEPCSVICNRKGHSAEDAGECAAKCSCSDIAGPANICWMLCVSNLPTSSCPLDAQKCSGQSIVCSASPTPTTSTPSTPSSTPTPVSNTTPAPGTTTTPSTTAAPGSTTTTGPGSATTSPAGTSSAVSGSTAGSGASTPTEPQAGDVTTPNPASSTTVPANTPKATAATMAISTAVGTMAAAIAVVLL